MSLAFVDDCSALAPHPARLLVDAGDPAGGKERLLTALAQALSCSPTVVDSLDAFYDALTDSAGAVAVLNAASWWQVQPLLLARVSQCFVDVGDRVSLTWVMADATADEAGARRWETGAQINGTTTR
jgi:hypothetical protein